MTAPRVAVDAAREARRLARRAWRYPTPAFRVALLLGAAVLFVAHEVRSVTVVHEARRERDAACRVAVEEIVRTSRVHDRSILPSSPCHALAELYRTTEEKVLAVRRPWKAAP